MSCSPLNRSDKTTDSVLRLVWESKRSSAVCRAEMSSAESGGIVSRPNLNFEPTFDQELLSLTHTCLLAEPLDSHAAYVEGAHRYIQIYTDI